MTTITPKQLAEMASVLGVEKTDFARVLHREYVITIAPPAPSEAMVKLAREITAENYDGDENMQSALAALQHVEKLVLRMKANRLLDVACCITCDVILTAIGSNRHD